MSRALGLETIGLLPSEARPSYDPRQARTGIVHLGAGAFFRAHVAAYADDVVADGNDRWGVYAVSPRSPAVSDALAAQDGLYAVVQRTGTAEPSARVVGSVRGTACAAVAADAVADSMADPGVRIVTLTVTEQAYTDDANALAYLVNGLERRAAKDAGPLVVVSCDNLVDNGGRLRELVAELADRRGGRLREWIEQSVSFPSTVVDRIVPATTQADRAEVERLIGLRDEVPVVTEPFRQWVVGGSLPDRHAWEAAGVTFTENVGGYEQVKLRLLNAPHCLVAYAGVLAGHPTIAAAMDVPVIAGAVRDLVDLDLAPTVVVPVGLDVDVYRDEVLRRFADPALRHTTAQVASDGSKKLPQRLLPALRELRAAGRLPVLAAFTLAAWIRVLGGRDDQGRAIGVRDPLTGTDQDGPARRVVGTALRTAFGPELADDAELVGAVAGWYDAIRAHGVHAALRER